MAISKVSSAAVSTVVPISASGTYTLSTPLDAGFYRLTTDTSQTLSSTQLLFLTDEGYSFGGFTRGGQGYVSLPFLAASVTLTAGTFPLLLGFEKFSNYPLADAPTTAAASVTWNITLSGDPTFDLEFETASTATNVGIYWTDGTFTARGSTVSPWTSVTAKPTASYGTPTRFLVAQTDSNGVYGYGVEVESEYPYVLFTTSGTYVPDTATADVVIVGGGGAGGGIAVGIAFGTAQTGAGASFAYVEGMATSGSLSVTVGAAGAAVNGGAGGNGGTTTFNGITCAGGNGGLAGVSNANPGPTGATSGSGQGGGAGNYRAGGGAGGFSGTGFAATSQVGGVGGAGASAFGLTWAGGAGGGAQTLGAGTDGGANGGTNGNGNAGARGGGGSGANKSTDSSNSFVRAGGAGGPGYVLIKPL